MNFQTNESVNIVKPTFLLLPLYQWQKKQKR